jgi:5'-methylthioadenosine phosphorylase
MVVAGHPAAPGQRQSIVLGVIGGSGLYQFDALLGARTVVLNTPFGAPSGPLTVGSIEREKGPPVRAVFLARHGAGHTLLPGEINYRANVHALKQLGVTHLLGVSAVGSLREDIAPGHVVLPDQFIDRTSGRKSTFFGDGVVAHVQFGQPTCPNLRELVSSTAQSLGAKVHDGGTCVVMEGPAFSSRAESELYRRWGAHVIGMTALPEAKLAREAELAYGLIALATDYDCWQEWDEVDVATVLAVLQANVDMARGLVAGVARRLPLDVERMPYPRALESALITSKDAIDDAARRRLDLIIGHYI